jgi:hypothetical protein
MVDATRHTFGCYAVYFTAGRAKPPFYISCSWPANGAGQRDCSLRNGSSDKSHWFMDGSGMSLQRGNGSQTQTTAHRTSAVTFGTLERFSSATVGVLLVGRPEKSRFSETIPPPARALLPMLFKFKRKDIQCEHFAGMA